MTAQQLFDILEQAIHDGHGNALIYFDTEAKTFNYHMARIGSVYDQDMTDFLGEPCHQIHLHEAPHYGPKEATPGEKAESAYQQQLRMQLGNQKVCELGLCIHKEHQK